MGKNKDKSVRIYYQSCFFKKNRIKSFGNSSRQRIIFFENTTNSVLLLKPKFNDHGESLDKEGNVLPNCPVCCNVINDNKPRKNQKLPCGEIFHKKCIDKWILDCKPSCPLCLEDYSELIDE